MNNQIYYNKYLKYKEKYNNLKLKKINGGTKGLDLKYKYDQIHFWMHQFEEHAVVISLAIEPDPDPQPNSVSVFHSEASMLKAKGIELHKRAKEYLDRVFVSKGIDENKIVLDESDYAKLNFSQSDISEAEIIVDDIRKYKINVINVIKECEANRKWLGWIMESLVQHMIDELDFYGKIIQTGSDLNNSYNVPEQISFWTKINAEHVGMASHFLDITYENDTAFRNAYENYYKAQEYIGKNRDQPINISAELQTYINTLVNITEETRNKLEQGQLKSVINPDIAFHDVREAERSQLAIQSLKNK